MKRYKLIFEKVPYAVAITDSRGNIIEANEAMAKLLGAKTEALPGKNISYFTGKGYLNSFKKQIKPLSSSVLTTWIDLRLGEKGGYEEIHFRIRRLADGKEESYLWIETGLKNKALKFQDMTDNLPAAVMEMDTEGNIIYANHRLVELFGYKKQEVEGRKNIKDFVLAEENEKLSANIFKLARGQMVGRNDYTAVRKDKKIIPVLSDSVPLRDPQGKVIGIRTVLMDIVQRKEFENRLKESEEKFRIFFNNANDPIFLYEFDPRRKKVSNFLEVNQVAVDRYGYTREEFLNMSIMDLLDKDTCKKVPLILDMISSKGRYTFEVTHLLEGGKKILVEASCRMYSWNDKTIVLSTARDITERKKAENQVRYYSFHDKLTGLYNRSYFEEELKRLDTRRQLPLSIILGDLDGLKLINDAFGHLEGDKLLVKTAKLLVECFREEDIVARWGGDEFAILLPKTASRTANELINRIKDKIKVETIQRIPLSISLGLATKDKAYQQIEEKLIEAEGFMYRAKLNETKKVAKLVIDSLRKALSEKLQHTPQINNIKPYAKKLGKMCGLKDHKLDVLMLLCDFYDIGLISVPDATLLSRKKLNKKDVKNIQKHPEVGYRICVASPHLSSIAFDVLSHHEWWNGNGYPQSLKENQIPLNSRIIAVIDAYKAMVNNRPYRKAMGMDKIIQEIRVGAGKQFDPDLVEKLISLISKD